MKVLTPKEAGRQMRRDPSEVLLPISEVLKFMKMDWEELRSELSAGRIVGLKVENNGTPAYFIAADELASWAGTAKGQHYWKRRSAS